MKIELTKIKTNIKNPRVNYDKDELEELKNSIAKLGQQTPIKVDENYVIIGGHRRYQALKQLGIKEAIVDVLTFKNEFEKSATMISDNSTQKQFNPLEFRKAISDIYWNEFLEVYTPKNHNDNGFEEFSKYIGIGTAAIKLIIKSTSKANDEILRKLEKNGLDSKTFDTILRLPKENQVELANFAVAVKQKADKNPTKYKNINNIIKAKGKSIMLSKKSSKLTLAYLRLLKSKIEILSEYMTEDILKNIPDSWRVELQECIEPVYKRLKNDK